jgi:hypothetical protein
MHYSRGQVAEMIKIIGVADVDVVVTNTHIDLPGQSRSASPRWPSVLSGCPAGLTELGGVLKAAIIGCRTAHPESDVSNSIGPSR